MIYPNMESVIDLTPRLGQLEKAMDSDAYHVYLTAKAFHYLPSTGVNTCSGDLIAQLYQREIEEGRKSSWPFKASYPSPLGFFRDDQFDELRSKIYLFFAYFAEEDLVLWEYKESEKHLAFVKAFWEVVEVEFKMPPTRCIEYFPDDASLPYCAAGWNCRGLFLDEVNKKGLFFFLEGAL